MKNNDNGLQKLDFINSNHSIVYAPNSAGKTRLTKKLAKKYSDEQSMFFTSTEVDNMLSFSGRKIFIGSDSNLKLENENIIKEYNKNNFGEKLLLEYGSKNASSLVKNSCLFDYIDLKRKDTFDIYARLIDFIKDVRIDTPTMKPINMVTVDKMLSKIDLSGIRKIANENIKLIIERNEYAISKELKDKIQSILDSIDSSRRFCPLCGYEYDSNLKLKDAISKMLEKYVISSDAHIFEMCVDFLNVLEKINSYLGFNYFETYYQGEIPSNLLLKNLDIIDEFLVMYSSDIIRKIDEGTNKDLFRTYKSNETTLEKEEKLRKNSADFCKNVVSVLNELITLPDGFVFKTKDDNVEIIDPLGKSINPKEFLSESEQRRMCISIVFAEINQRDLRYVVFDDPVDSNDDYYFDVSVNVIGDLLLSNQSLNWMILTHEFRIVSILSERCRLSDDAFAKNINFLFYLPDPSFNSSSIPPFSLISAKADLLNFLNEHETIIFRKIFTGVSGYQCDKELALLPSFNAARNLYNEIIKNHVISKHKTKLFCHIISTGNKSYEHYKNGNKRIMRLSTLYRMNRLMYDSINTSYYTNSRVFASNCRYSYVTTSYYHSIGCDNEVLKYILFAMIRVMNSHFLFEKKLAIWASSNAPSFTHSAFESATMLYNKLTYVKSICPASKSTDFNKFMECFSKWRGLLNDFAHGASRMFPPYLSISPMEMSKLETQIKKLP